MFYLPCVPLLWANVLYITYYQHMYWMFYGWLVEFWQSQTITCLAMCSSVTRDASTCVRIDSVGTSGSIHTRAATAFVDIYKGNFTFWYIFCMWTTRDASTCVRIDSVGTRCPIHTRAATAFVNIYKSNVTFWHVKKKLITTQFVVSYYDNGFICSRTNTDGLIRDDQC